MRIGEHTLGTLLASAGIAMVALTGAALVMVTASYNDPSSGSWHQLVSMIGASTCATVLIMGLLHSDLRRHYELLSSSQRFAIREARTDALTDLPNRKALIEDLGSAIDQSATGAQSCLVILDLDGFKHVNDTLGHEAGDALLRTVANKLRSFATNGHSVYRLGGDEFALILRQCALAETEGVCAEVQAELAGLHTVYTRQARIDCSVGVSQIVDNATASDMLRRSDFAMYRAKFKRGSIALFDASMRKVFERRMELAVRLKSALQSGTGISAKFQAIFSREMSIASVEGLFRWHDDIFGAVPTDEAIEIARTNQLLNEISLFMIERACNDIGKLDDVRLCLNIDAIQLIDCEFADALCELVAKSTLPSNRIQLEISESEFVTYGRSIAGILQSLASQGFKIAVDNLGSSTASLTYLKSVGVAAAKFDPAMLRAARNSNNLAVLRAQTSLAKSLGMEVTCKGISDAEDHNIAHQAGCDFFQGFGLSRPNAIDAFTQDVLQQSSQNNDAVGQIGSGQNTAELPIAV